MSGACLRFVEANACRGPSNLAKTSIAPSKSFVAPFRPHDRALPSHRMSAAADREVEGLVAPTVSRRQVQAEALLLALLGASLQANPAQAVGFKKDLKKKKIPIEDYTELRT